MFDAAIEGNDILLQGLLAEGVDTNVYYNKGQYPLVLAIECGRDTTARFLIEKANADVLNSCRYAMTPLTLAATQGNEDIVRLLLDEGANVNMVNYYGITPLISAVWNGNENIIRFLLDRGADVNRTDHWGYTALMSAACRCRKGAVRLLLDKGADVEARNDDGFTALDMVMEDMWEDARIIRKWLEERLRLPLRPL